MSVLWCDLSSAIQTGSEVLPLGWFLDLTEMEITSGCSLRILFISRGEK